MRIYIFLPSFFLCDTLRSWREEFFFSRKGRQDSLRGFFIFLENPYNSSLSLSLRYFALLARERFLLSPFDKLRTGKERQDSPRGFLFLLRENYQSLNKSFCLSTCFNSTLSLSLPERNPSRSFFSFESDGRHSAIACPTR